MVWVEWRKAVRSHMPLWTALGSLFMPLGIAFLIFIAKNPAISEQLGLVGAKANVLTYAEIDWPAYLELYGQLMAAGGFFLFILIVSWVFGREFADGTVKDLLAVPVARASILLAKFAVVAVWSAVLAVEITAVGLITGALIGLPGGSLDTLLQGSVVVTATAILTIVAVLPFALLASVGRGYLLPVGVAVLTLMLTNLVVIFGWGEYFPWSVPGLHAQAKTALAPVSYAIVLATSLAGMLATHLWWKSADQSR